MARGFRVVDRDTPMLLPPDLRAWLPADHLAWLVVEVIEACDLSAVTSSFRLGGRGRQAYDPRMLAAVLIYGYCSGIRSSRAIERACLSDVAFMVVTAQQRPDHSTLSRFRATHAEALAGLFGQVLTVCAQAGMGKVGVVAIDGTKIAANASAKRSLSAKQLRQMAAEIVGEASELDQAEDAVFGADRSGEELPETLRPGDDRASRVRQALQLAEQGEQCRVDQDVDVAERGLEKATKSHLATAERLANRSTTGSGMGRPRKATEDLAEMQQAQARMDAAEAKLVEAHAGHGYYASRNAVRRNWTDPDSRIMATSNKGFIQGFNAQAAVSDDHLIVAFDITSDAADRAWFTPMMRLAVTNVALFLLGAKIGLILADAGYCSKQALSGEGPDRLIATGHHPAKPGKNKHIQAMARRLAKGSPDRVRYQRRAVTVEPVFGHLKDRVGLRRFSRRGLDAARHEFALAATAHNLRRLAAHRKNQ
jgi:transposase